MQANVLAICTPPGFGYSVESFLALLLSTGVKRCRRPTILAASVRHRSVSLTLRRLMCTRRTGSIRSALIKAFRIWSASPRSRRSCLSTVIAVVALVEAMSYVPNRVIAYLVLIACQSMMPPRKQFRKPQRIYDQPTIPQRYVLCTAALITAGFFVWSLSFAPSSLTAETHQVITT